MKELKDYRTGFSDSCKIDRGVIELVRKYKEEYGIPIQRFIEEAVFEKLKSKGFLKSDKPK